MSSVNEKFKLVESVAQSAGNVIGESIKLKAIQNVRGILYDPDGYIKSMQVFTNQIQTRMYQHVADQLTDQGETAINYMSIGAGTGQGVGDNALASELAREGGPLDTKSHSAAVITYEHTFGAGVGTGTVTEGGLHDAASSGNMFFYTDSLNFAKGALDTYKLTWTVTISS